MKWAEILRFPIQDIENFLQITPAHQKDDDGHDFWETLILESRNRPANDVYLNHLVQVLNKVLNDEKYKITNTRKVGLIFFGIKHSGDTQLLAGLHRNVGIEEVIDENGDNLLAAALKGSSLGIANWCLNKMKNYLVSLREVDRVAILNSFAWKFPNKLSATFEYINADVLTSREYYISKEEPTAPLDKEKILNNFNDFRNIQLNEIALILEAKSKQSIYIITRDNMPALVDCLLMLLKNNTRQNQFKFQLIYYASHTFYGEIVIDKNTTPPKLKIFNCDPVLYQSISEHFVFPHLRELAAYSTVELYLSNELIQKAGGCCHCLAVEGCCLLATQKNADDIYEFMKREGTTSKINGFTVIRGAIHPRLKRSSHVYEDETKGMTFFRGIKSSIINSVEVGSMVVNKREETAAASVSKEITELSGKFTNNRIERKRDGYKDKVALLLQSGKIQTYDDLQRIIAKRNIVGLLDYCRNQCSEPLTLSS